MPMELIKEKVLSLKHEKEYGEGYNSAFMSFFFTFMLFSFWCCAELVSAIRYVGIVANTSWYLLTLEGCNRADHLTFRRCL